jgi:hypothetical protein
MPSIPLYMPNPEDCIGIKFVELHRDKSKSMYNKVSSKIFS